MNEGSLTPGRVAAYERDGFIFHCNLLHRSGRNDSDVSRRSMICRYNARSNDPYTESHHSRYTPLQKVPDSMIREVGARRFSDDPSNVAWLEDSQDHSARRLPRREEWHWRPSTRESPRFEMIMKGVGTPWPCSPVVNGS